MSENILTQDRLKNLLSYDPDTGVFTWRVSRGSRAHAGSVAGCLDRSTGYRKIGIDGTQYYAHRLAWLYMNGSWPLDEIDHENLVRDDNRWRNLRPATHGQNGQNSKPYGVSRFKGVILHKSNGKWEARATFKRKAHYLGIYDTEESAAAAYAAFAIEHFPDWARLT